MVCIVWGHRCIKGIDDSTWYLTYVDFALFLPYLLSRSARPAKTCGRKRRKAPQVGGLCMFSACGPASRTNPKINHLSAFSLKMGSDSSDKSKNDPLAPFLKSMGEDCDRPACDDTKSALTAALGRVNAAKKKKGEKQPNGYTACPPRKDEIGVSTWILLHSMVSGG
jgi:hypothetical protein